MESAEDIDTSEVLSCEESFFNALLAADHDSLGAILTDDFLIGDVMSGHVARRPDLHVGSRNTPSQNSHLAARATVRPGR